MGKKAEAKNNLSKIEEVYSSKYNRGQKIGYLQLYAEVKCNVSWETVRDYSISIDSMKNIIENYLNKYERFYLEEVFGLKSGKQKSVRTLQRELDLPYSAVRDSTDNAIRKIHDLIVMNYVSRDLRTMLKPLNPRLNIFDLPVAIKNNLIRLNLDLEKVQKMGAYELQKYRSIGDITIGIIRNYFTSKGIKW